MPRVPHHAVSVHPHEVRALELAFVVEDPCGEPAITLARETIRLIAGRNEVTVLALISELRALQFKYPRGKACTGCGSDDCSWLWATGRKCCPDCSHAEPHR